MKSTNRIKPLNLAIKLIMAGTLVLSNAHAAEDKKQASSNDKQISALDTITVSTKRENRVSTGATGLPLKIKETPQSITTIDQEDLSNFGITGSNRALELVNGIEVQQWETNRASIISRGYEVQLTQVDGMGTTNDYAVVVAEHDTFIYDKIEVIRGANGLLTGVGNSSGTVNYVRKRPTNNDEGLASLTIGSYNKKRAALDYNKVLTDDGSWAGRVVLASDGNESHIRDLENERSTFYGVIDGQIGQKGILTAGYTYQKNNQDSPMWGSITFNYLSGGYADFPTSTSTSVDWTYWNTESQNAFVEYIHELSDDWEAKLSYNINKYNSQSRLLYAYNPMGTGLNDDNTGLSGWAYAGYTQKDSKVLDLSISGEFEAFGGTNSLIAGISHADESNTTHSRDVLEGNFLALPALPYKGDAFAKPVFGEKSKRGSGYKELTRIYAASRLQITDPLHAIIGVNAIRLEREGSSIYGSVPTVTDYPVLEETSPYFGLTYDVTPETLVYASYSTIFQNQDDLDINGNYLDPMEGVNSEIGFKSEILNKKALATFAYYTTEQKGLATFAGYREDGTSYNVPKDVDSKGFEFEVVGKVTDNTNVALGMSRLISVKGVDGKETNPWMPRTSVKLRADTALTQVPGLKLGMNASWLSDAKHDTGAKQDAYALVNAFGAYEINKQATVRLNVNNLTNKKYIVGLQYGNGIYGAPLNANLTFDYKF